MSRKLKLLLDENIGLKVYKELRGRGFNVQSIIIEGQGMKDSDVIRNAKNHNKVIIKVKRKTLWIHNNCNRNNH